MLSDSHIHLSHPLFDGEVTCVNTEGSDETLVTANRDVLVDKMKKAGIAFRVEPAIELESNARILQYAGRYSDFLYPAIGLHPTRSFQTKWKYRKELEDLSKNTSVVAIGELGLDYHYERKKQHRMKQMAWFVWQLYLADKRQLPVILHIRLADRDAIRMLQKEAPWRGVSLLLRHSRASKDLYRGVWTVAWHWRFASSEKPERAGRGSTRNAA